MSSYTLKLHTMERTFVRGRPTLKDVDLKKREKNEKKRSEQERNSVRLRGSQKFYHKATFADLI